VPNCSSFHPQLHGCHVFCYDRRPTLYLWVEHNLFPHNLIILPFQDFHTVHAETALFIADQYFKTQSAVKYPAAGKGVSSMPVVSSAYLCLSLQMFSSVVRDLLCEQGKKVEIYAGSKDKWTLSQHVCSPILSHLSLFFLACPTHS